MCIASHIPSRARKVCATEHIRLVAALMVALSLFNLFVLATAQSILASLPTRIAQSGTGTMPPLLTGTAYRTYTVIAPFNATPTVIPQQSVLAPNKAALESIYTSLPQSMAGLHVVTYEQRFDAQTSMVSFALEGKNSERFTVRIEIYETEALACDRFRFFEQVMTEGHSTGNGTESLVAPDNPSSAQCVMATCLWRSFAIASLLRARKM